MSCVISGFQLEYVEEILERLGDRLDVKLVIVHPDRYANARRRLSPIPVLNRFSSRNGDFGDMKNMSLPVAIDKELRDYYSNHLEIGLAMFSRMDGDGRTIPTDERVRLFWKSVSVWESFVVEQKIDLMISREIPHFPSEYLLARVCERHGAGLVMTEFVEYLERRRIITSLDDRSFGLRENVSEESLTVAHKLIERLNRGYKDAVSSWIANYNLRNRETGLLNYLRVTAYLAAYGIHGVGRERSNINLALSKHDWTKNPSRFSIACYFYHARNTIMSLRRRYREMCVTDTKLPDNYIYFAPNYQPESTTVPDGNGFHYMPNVLRMLHDALPPGWKIIYKEHPAIFKVPYKMFFRGHMARSEAYYRDIELENVVFFPPQFDSFRLIDNSRFIVSVNGTILLESVARGKNALMMGNAWHEFLPGVRKIVLRSDLYEYIRNRDWERPVDREGLVYALASLRDSTLELLILVKKRNQDRGFVEREAEILCGKLGEYIDAIADKTG